MPLKMTNNATSLLSSSIDTDDLIVSITGGDEVNFPALGANEWCPITVTKSTGEREIMRCTARSGVNLTVERGAEGTAPLSFLAGDARVDVRLTAGAVSEIAIQDRIYSVPADLSYLIKTASNRWVWNDKFDGTGTDVATMSEIGAFTITGTFTAKAANFDGAVAVTGAVTVTGAMTADGAMTAASLTALASTGTSGNAVAALKKTATGNAAYIQSFTGTQARWIMYLGDQAAESGTRAGSNFALYCYNTTGTPFPVISATRLDGNVTIHEKLTVAGPGGMAVTGPTTINGGLTADSLTVNGSTDGHSILNLMKAGSGKINRITGMSKVGAAAAEYRWLMDLGNSAAESGVANGSDFTLIAYNNNNVSLGSALTITRSTLDAIFGHYVKAEGYYCRNGALGTYRGNVFNIDWEGGDGPAQLWIDGSNLGTISVSCDYRIKQDIKPLPSAWENVMALRPVSYQYTDYRDLFRADGIERWGFLAHELQDALLPSAAHGRKDDPQAIQSPDLMAIIAALTSALQEAMTRIEALEAKSV